MYTVQIADHTGKSTYSTQLQWKYEKRKTLYSFSVVCQAAWHHRVLCALRFVCFSVLAALHHSSNYLVQVQSGTMPLPSSHALAFGHASVSSTHPSTSAQRVGFFNIGSGRVLDKIGSNKETNLVSTIRVFIINLIQGYFGATIILIDL